MSFDLYIFDRDDLPDDEQAIGELLEDEARWAGPLAPRLAELVAELERQYPGPGDDPDASPWASWPLSDSLADGTGVALNIVWSHSEQMSSAVRRLAGERGLTVYDPQSGVVVRPAKHGAQPSPAKRKRWWSRG